MIPFISNLLNLPVTRKEVLKRAKKIKHGGICFSVIDVLEDYGLLNNYHYLTEYFPKFTKENALQFGADKERNWWWKPDVWDTGRMDFLDWLIEEYKDDKTDLRKL